MAHQLAALGVDMIEAGFPISSRGDLEAVRKVAQEVRTVPIAALARARKDDVNAAIEALEPAASPRLHIFLATSDLHLQVKLHMTREQALEAIAAMVKLGAQQRRRSGIFRGRRGAHRHRLSVRSLPRGGESRRDDIESAGHRGLRGAGRIWRDVPARARVPGRRARELR